MFLRIIICGNLRRAPEGRSAPPADIVTTGPPCTAPEGRTVPPADTVCIAVRITISRFLVSMLAGQLCDWQTSIRVEKRHLDNGPAFLYVPFSSVFSGICFKL